MPKILKRAQHVEQTAAFPEPDHAPEHAAATSYERRRTVSLRGVDDYGPDTDDDQETRQERLIPSREAVIPPSLDFTPDVGHQCEIPGHQAWAVQKFGRDREYHLCHGHHPRKASDLRVH